MIGDPGVPQMALDAQGRLLLGADFDTAQNGQSAANTQLIVSTATGVKRRILYVTVAYSAAVTQTVTIVLVSALGAAWNTSLPSIALSTNSSGIWIPPHAEFIIGPNDQIQVTAPAGGVGVTSAVLIANEILGLTARAVDATS